MEDRIGIGSDTKRLFFSWGGAYRKETTEPALRAGRAARESIVNWRLQLGSEGYAGRTGSVGSVGSVGSIGSASSITENAARLTMLPMSIVDK